jgi:hypothetical protein
VYGDVQRNVRLVVILADDVQLALADRLRR